MGPASGCVMLINFQTQLSVYLGMMEPELTPYFKELIGQNDKCFDVGGQGGYYALLFAKLSNAQVVSFECDSAAADEMRETFSRNPFKIQTIQTFVGKIDTESHTTLDTAARKLFIPDFIKLDIEGAEADALEGGAEILSTRKPNMIIEVHGLEREEECIRILKRYGYAPEIVNQSRFSFEHRPLQHNRWLICRSPNVVKVAQ